jgi:RND family efflux transporter MFP subunit
MKLMETDVPKKERTEDELRAEIESLKRQLEEQKGGHGQVRPDPQKPAPPSRVTLGAILLFGVIALVSAFVAGFIPHSRREKMLSAEATAQSESAPTVTVVPVIRSPGNVHLELPGNIQAVAEAPVLSRASGYVKKRFVDIGDRVTPGQLLAEIEAPELDAQVKQARSAARQAQSGLEQTLANLQQGKTNQELARVTAGRWSNLEKKGVVSRQENDNYRAQFEAQSANVQALEKAVAAARDNLAGTEANVGRLLDLQAFKMVRAPFSGVITLRNVDVGTLITESNTLLFRIAQTNILRTYVNVPQANADAVHVGQEAQIRVADLQGKQFTGKVTRTSNSLDPSSRTLLAEVQVPNQSGALLPGMYAQVDLTSERSNPPLLIPGDTLVVRPDGTQVAIVTDGKVIHFQRIELGRDYGDRVEVVSGVQPGQRVVVNPGDTVREGVKVNPVLLKEKPAVPAGPGGSH